MSILGDETTDELIRMARHGAPNEICGFILMDERGEGVSIHPVENIAFDPEHHFEMKPQDMLNAYESDLKIVGMYHSHPRGPAEPSEADLKYAPPGGMRYYIVTTEAVYEHNMEML